jgi:hypothetical protein
MIRWLLGLRSPSLEFVRAAEAGIDAAAADMPRIEAEEAAWRAGEEARLGRPLTQDERIARALDRIEPHIPQLRRIRAFAFGDDE